MAEAQNDQEPSIEEILASIREIISDDDQPAKEAEPEVAAAPEPAPAPAPADEEDDILDLAAFAEEPKEPDMPAEDSADPLAGIDFDKPKVMTVGFTDPLADITFDAPEPEPEIVIEDEPAFEPEPIAAEVPDFSHSVSVDEDSLLNAAAQSASLDSLAKLAQNIAISRAGNGGTLEDIVREMLKPMLRQWLDANLPPMIERMVSLELERLVKKAMDR